jgi:DNA invertase Pin-like site-specific DNA recombinase
MAGYADANEWALDPADVWDENLDSNGRTRRVSGGADLADRPRLAAAIDAIERGTHQILLAEHFDRLFRDVDVQRAAIRRVEAAGGMVVSVKQGRISHATAISKMLATVQGATNEYVKDTAEERSKAAVQIAIDQGRFPGPVPPGYVRDDDGVFARATDATVQAVREAFELRRGGATYGEVRDFLASRRIERTVSGVRKMLSSRLYVGEIHFGEYEPNLKAHPAIIDRDVFDDVQKMVVTAGRKAKSERLLARLDVLHCGTCGGRMSADTYAYPFYRCTSQACDRRVTIGADLIERMVVDEVKRADADDKGHARAAQRAKQAAEEAERAQAAYAKALRILAGADDEAEAQAVLAELRADRDAKRDEAARLDALVAPDVTVDVERAFGPDGTLDEQRSVIRTRVRRVDVGPGRDHGRVTIHLVG